MADLGEAGRNVNAWHWVEKDALPWSRERLQGERPLVERQGRLVWMGWLLLTICCLGRKVTAGSTHLQTLACIQQRPPPLNVASCSCLPAPPRPRAELLGSADLAPGSGLAVRGTGLKSCEGEAVVNNRKNKIIAAYELAVVVGWECVGEDGGTVAGELRMPYISEENHDEDPELQARCGSSSCAGGALAWAAAGGGPPPVAADLPGRGSHVPACIRVRGS